MNCSKCGKSLFDGVILHRQNEKGVDAIWACEKCNTLPIDPEVKEITEIIQKSNNR